MSFSKQVKQEICERELRNTCCIVAACYGVACFSRYFGTNGVELHTENQFVAQWALDAFALAGIQGEIQEKGSKNTSGFVFAVQATYEVEKMLALFGHTGEETAVRIHADNFNCQGCFSWFIAAAFLCCGTVVNPEKGYNLEFVCGRHGLTKDFMGLLEEKGFAPKHTVRKGSNVLYFKASEQIEDMLTFMGSTGASLAIMNEKVYKDFRNKANRIANCETANIDKTVVANQQILSAIRTLHAYGALETLPAPLQAAAQLRQEHPEYSLSELAAISDEPVSKSGLSHRYRKILAMAEAFTQTKAMDKKKGQG